MSVGRWTRAFGVVGLTILSLACDDPESKGSPATDPDGGEQAPLDGGDEGRGGGGGTDDGGLDLDKPFEIRGRLASAPGDKRSKAGGDAAIAHAITHVMAVNAATASPTRYLAALRTDGSFVIGVDVNAPWALVLVDSHQVGRDMVAGVFRAADFDLDTLAPTRSGMTDLGDLTIEDDLGATASIVTSDLLSSLGLSADAARLLGAMDDVSLRYVNPDVDGNGKIDVLEGATFPLDFHLRYVLSTGSVPIPLTALLNRFADPSNTIAAYGLGSAIVAFDPKAFGETTAADYRIRFPDAAGAYTAPPSIGGFDANAWIDDDTAFFLDAGPNTFGLSFNQAQPFPVGTYQFQIKNAVLTFTDVRTRSLAELNENRHLIVPFLKLLAPETTCEDWSCHVTGFEYRWRKRSEGAWVSATAEEIAVLIPARGGYFSFHPGGNPGKRLAYALPGVTVTGTVSFDEPTHALGMTANEVPDLTLEALCRVDISYDDTLGMRIFQGFRSAPSCGF
jgi:hypothetical protein